MSARSLLLASVASLGILAAACAGVLLVRGSGAESVRGVVLGAGLGAVGIVLEAGLLVRSLSLPRGMALGIVTAGFAIRLAILACGGFLLKSGQFADAASFVLSFVGGFFAGIPVVGVAAWGFRRPSGAAAL